MVYVAHMGRGEVHTGVWWEDQMQRDCLEDLDICWRIILKWISKKYDGEAWTGLILLRIGTVGMLLCCNAGNFLTSWGPVSF
jgi:hypothetical protein